jgi:fumarylacetoacetase
MRTAIYWTRAVPSSAGVNSATWAPVPDGSPFGPAVLPYGVFSPPGAGPRPGVRIGEHVLDLSGLSRDGLLGGFPAAAAAFASPGLDVFMAAGPEAWRATRDRLAMLLADSGAGPAASAHLHPLAQVRMHLPFAVADYADFYASLDHATNLGRILRPGDEPLLPNWRHLPVGYHGRAGTVVVSGTDVARPRGQYLAEENDRPGFGPSRRLDIELELGFVIGMPSRLGVPVSVEEALGHVFGVVLLNDWSARDLQAWEYRPLGPFLGKSFATTIGAWVTPLAALESLRVAAPAQDPQPLLYLREEPWAFDLDLEVELNGAVVAATSARHLYWTPAQMIAHLTANGACLRTGDLIGSGTISGPARGERGSLIELTWNGTEPLVLPDGTNRTFLEDGDRVILRGTRLGEAAGRIVAAPQ